MSHIAAPHGVLNTYGELPELKSRLGIAGNSNDPALWMALHAASRDIDAFCNRRFYVEEAVRCFDVADSEGFVVPDLVSISSMREDADRDRIYEVERTPADYILYPLNADPASHAGRPYNLVRADPSGPRPRFTTGRIAVQIDGLWGYRASRRGPAFAHRLQRNDYPVLGHHPGDRQRPGRRRSDAADRDGTGLRSRGRRAQPDGGQEA